MIEIRGIERLGALSVALARAADELDRRMALAANRAAPPVVTAAKESARRSLPRRHGMGRRVAAAQFSTRRRRTAQESSVEVVAVSPDSLSLIDRKGMIRHPVFGNRNVWVSQPVPPHWWTRPTERVGARAGQRELVRAANGIADGINRAA